MKNKPGIIVLQILFFVLFGFLLTANAASGDLDTTFSFDGIASEAIGGTATDNSNASVIQPDGKILIAGNATFGERRGCMITRFNPDGSFDTSFNGNGKAFYANGYSAVCYSLALQPDGKIIAAGSNEYSAAAYGGVIVRFNPTGTLDTTFDGDGAVTSLSFSINSIALQPDGKIVASGYDRFISGGTSLVARYNPNGSIDTSFNGNGMTLIANSGSFSSLAVQADGKIIGAGTVNLNFMTSSDFLIVRYNTDGSPDNSFDGDGIVTTHIDGLDQAKAVKIQSDGKILASGGCRVFNSNEDYALVRYNTDGSLDTSFDGDGKVTTDFLTFVDESAALFIQPDGKIVAAGSSTNGTNGNFSLARYNPNGSLDTSFDGDGKVTTPINNFSDILTSASIQPNGKIVAVGYSRIASSPDNHTLLINYNADGSLDTLFDGDGKLKPAISVGRSGSNAVAIQTDGKIVAAGFSYFDSKSKFTLARYNTDGSYDTTFGGNGKVILGIGNTSFMYAEAVAIQTDGKIVVGGYISEDTGTTDFAVARYNADGSPDTTFDGDGLATADIFGTDYLNAMIIQPDGKIAAAGRSQNTNAVNYGTLVRFNTDGSLDTSFDGDGKIIAQSPDAYAFNALAIQPDGRIIAAGESLASGGVHNFAVIRYNSNGSPDTTFNGSGKAITTVSGGIDTISGVFVQPDGKILAAGDAYYGNGIDRFAMARYNSNGTPDTSFDGDGIVTSNFPNPLYQSNAVVRTGNKILATTNGGLVRYNADGSLDTAYGTGGFAALNGISANNIALDSRGRVVLSGWATGGFFGAARVLNSAAAISAPFDFDGDHLTDIAIFRPSNGQWWIQKSANGGNAVIGFGNSSDKIVPADFTGDGKTDVAVWRPSTGEWFILRSENNSYYSIPFGTNGDVPVPADYDADGKYDLAVFRPSNSTWYINKSTGGYQFTTFGATGDVPVAGDYDGDGKADIAIYRPSAGEWWILRSATGLSLTYRFGTNTDIPVQGDYTGDGRTDSAIFRPSTGEWFILRSENNSFYSVPFGTTGDTPTPGDYDGDGKSDTAVFRPSGSTWYVNRSTAGIAIQNFGTAGDKPVPNAFVP